RRPAAGGRRRLDGREGRRGGVGGGGGGEDDVDPVVGRVVALGREAGPVQVQAVAALAVGERAQRAALALRAEVGGVVGVAAVGRAVGGDVGGVGRHRDGRREADLLPAGRRL